MVATHWLELEIKEQPEEHELQVHPEEYDEQEDNPQETQELFDKEKPTLQDQQAQVVVFIELQF